MGFKSIHTNIKYCNCRGGREVKNIWKRGKNSFAHLIDFDRTCGFVEIFDIPSSAPFRFWNFPLLFLGKRLFNVVVFLGKMFYPFRIAVVERWIKSFVFSSLVAKENGATFSTEICTTKIFCKLFALVFSFLVFYTHLKGTVLSACFLYYTTVVLTTADGRDFRIFTRLSRRLFSQKRVYVYPPHSFIIFRLLITPFIPLSSSSIPLVWLRKCLSMLCVQNENSVTTLFKSSDSSPHPTCLRYIIIVTEKSPSLLYSTCKIQGGIYI